MLTQKSNQKIFCQASECLSMYPIVRHLVHSSVLPKGQCPEACHALLAQAELLDLVFDGTKCGGATRDTLLPVVEKAILSFTQAFPEVQLIKKWHWLPHLPDTLARFQSLVSCFANERKRKPLGQLLTMTSNTTNYCKNLLEQALAKELCILDEPSQFKDGVYLVKNIQASQKSLQTLSNLISEPIHAARTSQLASINHVPCHKDDVVVYQTGPMTSELPRSNSIFLCMAPSPLW